jgi:DNA invertase Pin-like site-specific DNA recombinase
MSGDPDSLGRPDVHRDDVGLVVESLDRLGRSLQDLIAIVSGLRKAGVGFRSLKESIDTTTPGGRLVFHVFAALAEFIRELIVEGTLEGLDAARARGQRLGRPPAMTPEQVGHARAMLAQPKASIASIARLLGVSRSTLYKYVPELKEGSDARAVEADVGEPAAVAAGTARQAGLPASGGPASGPRASSSRASGAPARLKRLSA